MIVSEEIRSNYEYYGPSQNPGHLRIELGKCESAPASDLPRNL